MFGKYNGFVSKARVSASALTFKELSLKIGILKSFKDFLRLFATM
jgi:hypothetical protein